MQPIEVNIKKGMIFIVSKKTKKITETIGIINVMDDDGNNNNNNNNSGNK